MTSAHATPTLRFDSVLEERLAQFIGPFTAHVAMSLVARKKLGRPPAEIERGDVAIIVSALLPMLRTLVGPERTQDFVLDAQDAFVPRLATVKIAVTTSQATRNMPSAWATSCPAWAPSA